MLILLGCIVAGSVWWVQKQRAIDAEKAAFEASFLEVQTRADRLSAEFKPDERTEEKTCDYASAKFGKGSLSCSVGEKLFYQAVSVDKANEIMQKSNSINPSGELSAASVGTIKDVPYFYTLSKAEMDRKVTQIVVQEFTDMKLKCYTSYEYFSAEDARYEGKGNTIKPVGLEVSISCYSNTKAEHYPVVE